MKAERSGRVPRILVVSRNYPNNVTPTLGIWLKRFVQHCAEQCEVKVVAPVPYCPPLKGFPEQYTRFRKVVRQSDDDGVEVIHPRFIVGPGRSLYYTEALSFYLGIRRQVDELKKRFDFEIVQAWFGYPDGVVAAMLGRHYGVPVVITEQAPWKPNWMEKSRTVRRQSVWAARESMFMTAPSKAIRDTIAHFTGEPEKIRIVANGVDGSVFTPLQNGIRPNANQVVYAGFINFNKGVDILLKAMRQIVDRRPQTRLVLVGGSIYRSTLLQEERLREMAHELGLDANVDFVGSQPAEEVSRHMRESAVAVLPSRFEAFGIVVVEAMACGTPVVASRSGGPQDIINDKVGVLVPTEDVDALASALERVLESRDDYDSAAIRAYALDNYSWRGVARQTVDIYEEAIDRFQHRGVEANEANAVSGPVDRRQLTDGGER